MEKIKKFIDCIVPVRTCNLRCHYCYITLRREFDTSLPIFKYSARYMAKALSKKRLGGTCCINLCGGGETLLPPEMTEIIEALLKEGHYVMVVTNGTVTKRFEEIVQLDKKLLERLFFKFSFQFLELKRTNQMEQFFNNIKMVKDAGCSYSLEITPNDELIPYIDDVKQTAIEHLGALPHVSVARDSSKKELPILTKLSDDDYKKTWSTFDSKMFSFKHSVFNKKRKEFCYAGTWTYYLDLGTGDLKQCYKGEVVQNIFEDLEAPLKAYPVGCHCSQPHCYNAHAWLTFGTIPELDTPVYLEMRDRITDKGEHWVTDIMGKFLGQKLSHNNVHYSNFEKFIFEVKYYIRNIISFIFMIRKKNKHIDITVLGIKIKIKTRTR